jgi:F0F1-type ATP synthase assembly protein I
MGPLFGAATSMFNTHPWMAVGAIGGIILGALVYNGSITYALIGGVIGAILGYVVETVTKSKPPA